MIISIILRNNISYIHIHTNCRSLRYSATDFWKLYAAFN